MKKLMLLLNCLIMLAVGNAQKLFVPDKDLSYLSDEQNQSIEEYKEREFIKELFFVKIGLPQASINDNTITFTLPNQSEEYTMEVEEVNVENEGEFSFAAKFRDDDSNEGYLLLNSFERHIAGSLQINNEFYRIFPVNEAHQILIKMNAETESSYEDDAIRNSEMIAPTVECAMTKDACIPQLIIFYTKESLTDLPTGYNTTTASLTSFGQALTDQLNKALGNSKVLHRIKPVSTEEYKDKAINSTAKNEYYSYRDVLADPKSKSAIARKNKKADIVVFLTKGNNYGTIGGTTPTPAKDFANAHSVIKMSGALSYKAFIHEIGHFFGADHEDGLATMPVPARAFKVGKSDWTIMHSIVSPIPILYYSNPDVKYKNIKTGSSTAYNACVIQKYGCTLSKFID